MWPCTRTDLLDALYVFTYFFSFSNEHFLLLILNTKTTFLKPRLLLLFKLHSQLTYYPIWTIHLHQSLSFFVFFFIPLLITPFSFNSFFFLYNTHFPLLLLFIFLYKISSFHHFTCSEPILFHIYSLPCSSLLNFFVRIDRCTGYSTFILFSFVELPLMNKIWSWKLYLCPKMPLLTVDV